MKALILSTVAAATAILSISAMAQVSPGAAAATQVDPTTFVNQFEATTGKFEGYRRSGAKGICAAGEFVGTPDARALSTASGFNWGQTHYCPEIRLHLLGKLLI